MDGAGNHKDEGVLIAWGSSTTTQISLYSAQIQFPADGWGVAVLHHRPDELDEGLDERVAVQGLVLEGETPAGLLQQLHGHISGDALVHGRLDGAHERFARGTVGRLATGSWTQLQVASDLMREIRGYDVTIFPYEFMAVSARCSWNCVAELMEDPVHGRLRKGETVNDPAGAFLP